MDSIISEISSRRSSSIIRNIFQRNGRWLDASNQIERNKEFIQESTLTHIKTVHPTLSWNTLSTKCFRDIGFIVDALAHDIRFGGNEKTIVSLEKYFNKEKSNNSQTFSEKKDYKFGRKKKFKHRKRPKKFSFKKHNRSR